MLEELCKRIQHCCATLRWSRNKRNVGSCWLKSLTGFKLCATTRNKIQQHATGCANGPNMFDMLTLKWDWNIKFLLWKQRGRWVETKLSQSIPFHSCTLFWWGLNDEFPTRTLNKIEMLNISFCFCGVNSSQKSPTGKPLSSRTCKNEH